MIVHNIRLGFANNSSSSHSILILDKPTADQNDVADDNFEFGWDYFTASSEQAKRNYFAATLYSSVGRDFDDARTNQIVAELTGVDLSRHTDKDGHFEGYVDHESVYAIPRSFHGDGPNEQFCKDMLSFLLNPKLAILGGNDNDNEPHPLGTGFTLPLPQDSWHGSLVARKDGDYWAVFNRKTGAKVRFSFEMPKKVSRYNFPKIEPVKSTYPELVDVKITDYCPLGCPFCYQSSTHEGVHGNFDEIERLAKALGKMEVFEVALGGGEPTLHPRFLDILKVFRDNGIVPNFTTKRLAWLKDDPFREAVFQSIGSFAYSASKASDVDRLAAIMKGDMRDHVDYPEAKRLSTVQIVMGTVTKDEFLDIVKTCEYHAVPLTLLGYKRVGFGEQFKPIPYDWWLPTLLERRYGIPCRLCIDTAIVKEFKAEIQAAEVNPKTYHEDEGKFSCYIDAVERRIAPSSYCDSASYRTLDFQGGLFEAIVASYREF